MNSKNANHLMDEYNDLSEYEKSIFKKRFNELLKFERQLKEIVKNNVKQRIGKNQKIIQ